MNTYYTLSDKGGGGSTGVRLSIFLAVLVLSMAYPWGEDDPHHFEVKRSKVLGNEIAK
jgi:hypothetical protein